MRRTAVLIDSRFEDHDPGSSHPECAARVAAIGELLGGDAYRALVWVAARPATEEEILRVHTAGHLRSVASSRLRSRTRFDPDTAACEKSYDTAMLAAGGAIELVDAILEGRADNGLAAVRPPGHHAEPDRVMGFCFFNNVAVVARHLLAARGLDRVLIVDWDVHHGNGTQRAFYSDAAVLYISLHQYPYYPGSGASDEIGTAAGAGYTVNLPMVAGSGSEQYLAAFREIVLPVAKAFSPNFVLVSAGFDAHRADPLASMALDESTFAAMTDALVMIADESCQGRVAAILEGGYDLAALANSVAAVVGRLRDPRPFAAGTGELPAWSRATRDALRVYWNL